MKRQLYYRWVLSTLLLIVPMLFSACGGSGGGGAAQAAKVSAKVVFATTGTLDQLGIKKCTLTITSSNSALSMPSPIDLYALYTSSGTSSVTVPDLKAGEPYTFTITAYDSNNALIYQGSATQVLQAGSNSLSIVANSPQPSAAAWQTIGDVVMGTPYSIAVDPTNSLIVYVGTTANGIYKSTNGGATWTAVSSDIPAGNKISGMAVDKSNNQVVYAATSVGLYKSSNGGSSWVQSKSGRILSLALSPLNTQVLYVGTLFGVSKTTDGAASWTDVNNGLPPADVQSLAFDPSSNLLVYAGCYFNGIYNTTDGGLNWTGISSGISNINSSSFYSIAVDSKNGQVLYVGKTGGIFKSTDGGASWSEVFTGGSVKSLAIDPTNSQIIYAAIPGTGVVKSKDGGTSWSAVNGGITDKNINAVTIDPASHNTLYAVGAGVYKTTTAGE